MTVEQDFFCRDLPTTPRPEVGTVLVTGASGYIGGRLVPELAARGYRVRAMVRPPLPARTVKHPGVETVACDVLEGAGLAAALEGVHTAYYLIHSLVKGPERFRRLDIEAARRFREAAAAARIHRIIYLGGVGAPSEKLSDHLRSRQEVARELERGRVPLTVLRASVIIGSGSASYEILINLVRKLPVIFLPPWAENRCQPVAVRDVIRWLVGVLEAPESTGRTFDLGGPDVLTYGEMLQILAGILGIHRRFVRVPVSNLRLFAYLASLLTPVPAPITLCLMEGLTTEAVAEDRRIRELLPFEPLGYAEAVRRALAREARDRVSTRWSDAYTPSHAMGPGLDALGRPPRYRVSRTIRTDQSAEAIFHCLCRLGGRTGWFGTPWMWRLRGAVDRLLLGVGTARGRRTRDRLAVGDVVDFFRVEALEPPRRLLLRAEMKMPGRGWLEFAFTEEAGERRLTVTAWFDTDSLWGKAYWYALLPFHRFAFKGLLRHVVRRA